MDFSQPQLVSYILAYGGIIGVIWFLFSKSEDTLNDKTKKSITRWLKNLNPVGPVKSWPSQFAAMFDKIFGEKHLGLRCFLRSSVASIVATTILTLIWIMIRPEEFNNLYDAQRYGYVFFLGFQLSFSSAFNIIPDYISLLETRLIIRHLRRRSSSIRTVALLAVDVLLTALIWKIPFSFIGAIMATRIMGTPFFQNFIALVTSNGRLLSLSTGGGTEAPAVGIYFYSTFFTSVWIWAYVFSGIIVKLARSLDVSVTWLRVHFDIETKPLRSMAMVSILIVTMIFVIVPFVR